MPTVEENKRLIERYPFLLPYNRWTDKTPNDYDYRYTELDAMPNGWRIAFGEQMCEEIRDELLKIDYLDKYRITQIKEKYGSLRWYSPSSTNKILHEIIPKYEKLSAHTCIECGNPATKISQGWISPYCDQCAEKINQYESFIDIDKWFEEG